MQHYLISKISERVYTFTSSIGCVYHCYFFDFSAAFSDYPALAANVFGFNLELKEKPEGVQKIPPDKKIAVTVVDIVKAFLNEKENTVIYICDTIDNRHKARFHKFNHWFEIFNDGNYLQLKGSIRAGGIDILNALLMHRENPLANDFIEAYHILTGVYIKPDDDELQNMLNDDGW
ncbi:MAG: hypothetical protein HYR66_00825 [Sphingobacteriales bacterium]|nr:hypothetical protein [Sphingobacteriales bacterium]MBI3717427.1 hypothetical protein [Sphingobacteriales bacterium]